MKKFLLLPLLLIGFGTLYGQLEEGVASFYADKFEGRITANGEVYEHQLLTAAHKLLPFGTRVKVTNLKNNLSVIVKINDRGPFVAGRIIDLSKSAAEKLEFIREGITKVKLEVLVKSHEE